MSHTDRIEAEIEKTQDPVQRATLSILAKIDTALDANTAATQRIATSVDVVHRDLTRHINDEEKLLASIRGGQLVGGFLITCIVVMASYVINLHFSKNDAQDKAIASQDVTLSQIRTVQLEVLRRLDVLEDQQRSGK